MSSAVDTDIEHYFDFNITSLLRNPVENEYHMLKYNVGNIEE